MEASNIKENFNINKIKNLIRTLINRQLGDNLIKLEQKNKNEINDINIMSKTSKILINNLSYVSKVLNKNKLHDHKASNLNIKKVKSKKNLLNGYNKKNQNLILRKSFTPLKSISKISKLNMQNNNLLRSSTKSLDIVLKKNRSNRISSNYLIKKSTKSTNIKYKNKKSSKEIYKTPKRKNTNISKQCKTEERLHLNNNKLYNDISLLDNGIDIYNNYDQRISNLEMSPYENKNSQKEELSPERISLKLGPLIETIDNEKRIYFLGDNLFKKDFIPNTKQNKIKSKNNYYNNSFLIMIEYIFDYLYAFLDNKSIFNLLIVNKDFFKLILRLIIAKLEKKIKRINQNLLEMKQNNMFLKLEENYIKSFDYNINSNRAISLLNPITVENFFNEKKIDFNNNLINLIFDLYFISIGKKSDIISLNFDNKLKEPYIINHFKNNNNKYIGPILDYEIKHIIFNNEIINALYDYSHKYINIISPNYFQKINKNIALFSFLIKNILEHIGITKDLNNIKNAKHKYQLFNSRLYINQEIIKRLKSIKDLY